MTDNEIIKAVECCFVEKTCRGCPFDRGDYGCSCIDDLRSSVFDLINRQKAEIERLEKGSLKEAMTFNSKTIANIRAEAIKEFAENFKQDIKGHRLEMYMNGLKGTPRTDEMTYETIIEYIDNLLKEMEGE